MRVARINPVLATVNLGGGLAMTLAAARAPGFALPAAVMVALCTIVLAANAAIVLQSRWICGQIRARIDDLVARRGRNQTAEVVAMKNEFISRVSHELRTPLASIKAYSEMLVDGEADDPVVRAEFYQVIQCEANRLDHLIASVLNISRIEAGLIRVNKRRQCLAATLASAVQAMAPQAQLKGIRLTEHLTPESVQAEFDQEMIYQAIVNLLSNAVKYTPDGGCIRIEAHPDAMGKRVITKIIDDGVGIPPKDQPFVFDKFFRSDANSRMASGTGLGLSLVKHIVETVHQGRVFLMSEVGKGSCFGFELDLCQREKT